MSDHAIRWTCGARSSRPPGRRREQPGRSPFGTEFVVAETPIEPIWEGDGYDWKPANATAAAGTENDEREAL